MMTISGFSFSSSSRKSLYVFGLSPLRSVTCSAATSRVFSCTSQSPATFTRPLAMASRRMFFPHQPQPMSAVRNFFAGSAARMKGADERTVPAMAVLRMKWRRVSRGEIMTVGFFCWNLAATSFAHRRPRLRRVSCGNRCGHPRAPVRSSICRRRPGCARWA